MTDWAVEHGRGSAGAHHARPFPEEPRRSVWVYEVERPALVLGSAQQPEVADMALAARLGIEVVRRRSGGGAVMLVPGEVAWLDVILPAGDPLWDDDVSRSGLWLGHVWRAALGDVGLAGATVHDGPLACGDLGRLVCFGAVGPGEVTYEGRKVVGVSQRRVRTGARFQCVVYRQWAPMLLGRLLRLGSPGILALADAAMGTGVGTRAVADRFLRRLTAMSPV